MVKNLDIINRFLLKMKYECIVHEPFEHSFKEDEDKPKDISGNDGYIKVIRIVISNIERIIAQIVLEVLCRE